MAFSFFKKKDAVAGATPPVEGGAGGSTSQASGKRDERKARRFFEYAQAVADSRNYDYAIECYVNGLRHDPENLQKHEALYDVAKRRKVAGGKPPGLTEKLSGGGRDPIERMLHAEALWAKDPINVSLMAKFMERAVEADEAESELNLGEIAHWIGSLLLETNSNSRKPSKEAYLTAKDLFARMEVFDKAVEACKYAVQMDEENSKLVQELKDLDAELTMRKGNYTMQAVKAGGSKGSIRDIEKQKELNQDDSISQSDSVKDERIARRRAEYEEDRNDVVRIAKLAEVLADRGTEEAENEAISLNQSAWEISGQYRYKELMGDIRMRQLNRHLREIKAQVDAHPNDAELKKRYHDERIKTLQYELEEFTERVKNYPTDMPRRFEQARRLHALGKYDDAIVAFQQAIIDPKRRSQCHYFLGLCYIAQGYHDEAIASLREGIENHPLKDDRLGLDLRYLLMDAMENAARKTKERETALDQARQAAKVASQILQSNIGYRDIRQRVDRLRKLIDDLSKATSTPEHPGSVV